MAFRVPFRWHVRSLCPNSNNINRFGQLGVHRRYQGFYRFGGGSQYERFNGSSYSRSAFWRWVQSPTFYYQVAGIGVLASGFYIINLETVPISGRRRFNIISIDMEQQLGDSIKQQTLSQYKGRILSHGERRHILVQRVLNKLIPASGLQENKWEIYVIDDPSQKNAFVIPGGKVFVFTGILPICGAGEDGVATVLSHEIAHTVARHSAEKMSQMFLIYGLGILALALGIDPGISHVLADLGYSRPGSRRQEVRHLKTDMRIYAYVYPVRGGLYRTYGESLIQRHIIF